MVDNTEDRNLRAQALQAALSEHDMDTNTDVLERARVFYRFLNGSKGDEKSETEQP